MSLLLICGFSCEDWHQSKGGGEQTRAPRVLKTPPVPVAFSAIGLPPGGGWCGSDVIRELNFFFMNSGMVQAVAWHFISISLMGRWWTKYFVTTAAEMPGHRVVWINIVVRGVSWLQLLLPVRVGAIKGRWCLSCLYELPLDRWHLNCQSVNFVCFLIFFLTNILNCWLIVDDPLSFFINILYTFSFGILTPEILVLWCIRAGIQYSR